jgi:hypothetical protein
MVMGYLTIFETFVRILNGLNILMNMNPEITPAKCPKNEA